LLKDFFIQGKRSLVVTGTTARRPPPRCSPGYSSTTPQPSYLLAAFRTPGQGARFTDSDWFIIEGDEYDTAFFDKRSNSFITCRK